MKIEILGVKLYVSPPEQFNYHPHHPKGFTWNKTQKKDTNTINTTAIIMLTQENKIKAKKLILGCLPTSAIV